MHKDLSDNFRAALDGAVQGLVHGVFEAGQSLALAREHLIASLPPVFDKTAEELDAA